MRELGQGMQPRETGLDRRGEAWGDYEGPDTPRPTVQELFARTRKGLATPRQGRVRRPDAIGFAMDRRGFWLLCAGGVVTVMLVFLAGFLAGLGTNIDPPETASAPIAEAPAVGAGPARPFDPPLPAPAPPVDPRLAELGPAPMPQNAIPAVPAAPPAQPMLSPLAVQGVTQPPPPQDTAIPPSPAPATPAPVPLVQAAPPAPAPAPPVQAAPAPAPASSPPPSAIAAPPSRSGDWVLQFGAFRGRENAERLAASLRGRVEGVRVQSATGPGGTALFHVWAGGFTDRDAAAAEAARLKAAHGLDAFATRP